MGSGKQKDPQRWPPFSFVKKMCVFVRGQSLLLLEYRCTSLSFGTWINASVLASLIGLNYWEVALMLLLRLDVCGGGEKKR